MTSSSTSSQDVSSETPRDQNTPEFIYGGPFINNEVPSPFMNTSTPINLELQGTYVKSFAFYTLKERLPIILTKVIDSLAKGKGGGNSQQLIAYIAKLKNELVTNKEYELLSVGTPNAKKWNEWIAAAPNHHYFTNTWLFSECYIYRRLREGCELINGMQDFDPFEEQKAQAFKDNLEAMAAVADRIAAMLPESDKDKRKNDFITLLKLCLWSNKCDLSLSDKAASSSADPIQVIADWKDKLLVDDTAKIVDTVVAKADAMRKSIEGAKDLKTPSSSSPPPEGDQDVQQISCPSKVTIPQYTFFDIVCDNAGYELFADLCLASFLISQKIVQKVRFHVKNIPWFVSDVTPKDFQFVVNSCAQANFTKEYPAEQSPENAEPESPPPAPRVLTSEHLRALGDTWQKYYGDGTFIVSSDDFWTSPHVYKDMKKYAPHLYRQLQLAVAVLFKGDLNYRKLLGERNWNPYTSFETALQGFMPAPLIAARTVKADLICGLPKGKFEQLSKEDPEWMTTGNYGVIQLCPKAEPLKPAEVPCVHYGDECRGAGCPPPDL